MDLLGNKMRKRICLFSLVAGLVFTPSFQALALEGEVYQGKPSVGTKTVVLEEMGGSYEVKRGDCLYGIAKNLWGEEGNYLDIYRANQDVLTNPDMLYPGMQLSLSRTVYFNKISERSSVHMGKYGFYMFPGWTVGIEEMGQAWSNLALFLDESEVIGCLIQDKQSETEETLRDWEQCQEEIKKYAKENYAEQVEDLTFLQYRTENGDYLYLYYYTYLVDLTAYGEEGNYPVNVCMGIRLTDTIQAEFIYYGLEKEDGLRQVRYAAATFYEEEGMENTSINDQNMQLNPQVQWPMEGIFNSFGWIEAAFTLETEPEKTPTDLFRNSLSRF